MNEVIKDIKKEIPNNQTIIIATSGGPDSMCLINIINTLKEEKKIKIICAHVNHQLREESKEEAQMVKKYCLSNNITYEYMEINEYKGNIENYARKKRYDFFEKLIKKYNAHYILTAHHGDDLIETMLMRISRGTRYKGYIGFTKKTKRDNYIIYRPLITKTKEEIIKYLKENNIKYAIDKTNFQDKYTRNRYRKYILKPLKKENKNIHKQFLKLSETIEMYEKYIYIKVKEVKNDIYKNNKIDIKKLNEQEKIIKQKVIYEILKEKYTNDITLIKDYHIDQIIKILENKKPNMEINLPKKYIFSKEYNYGKIIKHKGVKKYNYILNKEIKLPNNHIIKIVKEDNDNSNYCLKINSKQVKTPLHIRTRKKGDKIEIKGLNGSKKIKDIFIDEKIPIKKRETYPILTDNDDNILWIPGLKKSKFDVSKTENYDIIIKYF